jgi:hypothetical protein
MLGHLIADEGIGTVIPAIEVEAPFPVRPKNGREYLLQEIASALSGGMREEVLRESSYLAYPEYPTNQELATEGAKNQNN